MHLLKIMVFAVLIIPVPILAGYKYPYSVSINSIPGTDRYYAAGSVSNARYGFGADPAARIGCSANTYGEVVCEAKTPYGVKNGGCRSVTPIHHRIALSIKSSSYVYFEWNASGQCTRIIVKNGSLYLP